MISSASTAFVLALLAPVQWIVDLLHPVLLFFHDFGVGWGTSIVLLTVVVRALLAPLTIKQFKSMQSMVRVAPELKALQAKHKDDKQRQQQEVMKFYAENKINPFASCLPLVAQMPFFIGLFYLLQSDLRRDICGPVSVVSKAVKKIPCENIPNAIHGHEDFLFIPDLTVKATGVVLVVLIVLYISSQLLSSILTPSTADRNQKMIMYGLPFVFVIFVQAFPAGLIVYWITTNLWTVGQGYVLRRRMGPIHAPKVAGTPALAGIPGPNADGRGSGFMARLAAITGAAAKGGDDPPAANGARGKGAAQAERPAKVTAGTKAKDRTPATTGAKSAGVKAPGTKTSGAKATGGRASRASKSSGTAAEPAPKPARTGPPPPPPRKKKKRSGRRR
jgi:YidC/Oxa1 family membrane protein insertase